MRTFLFVMVLGFSLLGLGKNAVASSIYETDNLTMEMDGSLKFYVMGLHMNYPWSIIAGGLGWDSKSALMGLGEARIGFSGAWKEDIFKWQFQLKGAAALYSQVGIMNSIGGGTGNYEPSYLFPLQYTDSDDPNVTLSSLVDRMNIKFRLGKLDFILGRQAIGLGVGFIWQPADLLGTFSPLEIDRENKPGVDAIRINWTPGQFTEVAFIGVAGGPGCNHISFPDSSNPLAPSVWQTVAGNSCTPGEIRYENEHSSAAVRLRTTFDEWDIGILGGYVRGDLVGGIFFAGSIKKFNFKGEATFTHDMDTQSPGDPYYSSKNNFIRSVLGMEYSFDTKKSVKLVSEIYYNGFGTDDPSEYLNTMSSARTAVHGEVLNPGMLYGAVALNIELSDKIKMATMAMGNFFDASFHLSSSLDIRLDDNSSIVLGGYVPIGKKPEINLSGTGNVLKVNSEFGLYPTMIYVQYKRYY
ncbi:MAG: hypothetical protein JXR95_16195 [Deltaproteobacteria bacterium]|nr:hypothetical protein [Deltaproteobacteria bacterium]